MSRSIEAVIMDVMPSAPVVGRSLRCRGGRGMRRSLANPRSDQTGLVWPIELEIVDPVIRESAIRQTLSTAAVEAVAVREAGAVTTARGLSETGAAEPPTVTKTVANRSHAAAAARQESQRECEPAAIKQLYSPESGGMRFHFANYAFVRVSHLGHGRDGRFSFIGRISHVCEGILGP